MTKRIAVFLPQPVLGMSAMLIKNLCWIASNYANHEAQSLVDSNPAQASKSSQPKVKHKGAEAFSIDGQSVQCLSSGAIEVDASLDSLAPPDAVFLSAFWGEAEPCIEQNHQILPALQRWQQQGVPIAGFSNAPFLMAEAGLLDGKVATVYPPLAEAFAKRYPKVHLRSARALTDAGNLYCANGIASGCDLIISVLEILYGPDIARRMNQEFLVGFQRQYSLVNFIFDGQKYHSDHQILTAQHWLERNYQQDVSIETLAADRGMSPRNFSRRFKQATDDSPSQYLQRVRMEVAKELLSSSEDQVASIAFKVGYSDSSYFSRIFKKSVGCLPQQFRG